MSHLKPLVCKTKANANYYFQNWSKNRNTNTFVVFDKSYNCLYSLGSTAVSIDQNLFPNCAVYRSAEFRVTHAAYVLTDFVSSFCLALKGRGQLTPIVSWEQARVAHWPRLSSSVFQYMSSTFLISLCFGLAHNGFHCLTSTQKIFEIV